MKDITPKSYTAPSSAETPYGVDFSGEDVLSVPMGTMISPKKGQDSLGGLYAGANEVSQGSGNDIFKISSKGIHLGAANFADAPFSVDMQGNVVAETLVTTELHIPNSTTANSFHVDTEGNTWWGATTLGASVASVTKAGVGNFSNITISGGSVDVDTFNGIINLGNINVAAMGWTQTSAFSVTDADTVACAAGTFTSADGTAYSIGGGNTGNMAAATYIYLDVAVSTTAYQTTTTAATAVGAGKVLIAKAENGTGEASFQDFGGIGGANWTGSSIVANSITANELSTSITYAGSIIIDTAGLIRSGQTAYDTGTGWFIGNDGGTPKLSIGNSAGNKITWDGSTLTIVGTVPDTQVFTSDGTWTKPTGAQFVRVVCVSAGGGGGGGVSNAAAGGGGGAITERIFRASDLSSTVSITIGTGGSGGAANNDGSAGGTSSFGAYLLSYGGGGGCKGSGSNTTGGGGGGVGGVGSLGVAGADNLGGVPASTAGANGISGQGGGGKTASTGRNGEYGGGAGGGYLSAGGSSLFGAGGGGSGGEGGLAGIAGGAVGSYTAGGGGAGGAAGNPGVIGTAGEAGNTSKCGAGGGGGGGSTLGTGGAGGAGGVVGGGGGGGGGGNGGA